MEAEEEEEEEAEEGHPREFSSMLVVCPIKKRHAIFEAKKRFILEAQTLQNPSSKLPKSDAQHFKMLL